MIVRKFDSKEKDIFIKLCEEFYSSHSTIQPFNVLLATTTFNRVLENHENLWGYFIIDSATMVYVGYALVSSYWCNEEGGNILVLDELYISPNSRHHGYGSKFLEWLEHEFKGKSVEITLEVLKTNQDARSLYKKDGLVPDGFITYTKKI